MKKVLISLVSVILVVSLCSVFASAASINLVPSDATYENVTDMFNNVATITFDGGKAAVSFNGTSGWPSVKAMYASPVTVDINKYSLHYDFTVDTGATNIVFYFGADRYYSISNSALANAQFDPDSGDLAPGTYSGTIALSDLVNSTTNYAPAPFDKSNIVDNKLTFAGIQIYSVNGATVTINALELVCEDEPEDTSSDAASSEGTASDAASSDAASSDTSSTGSTEPSTGDAGIIMIAVLSVVALAGASAAIKARR